MLCYKDVPDNFAVGSFFITKMCYSRVTSHKLVAIPVVDPRHKVM